MARRFIDHWEREGGTTVLKGQESGWWKRGRMAAVCLAFLLAFAVRWALMPSSGYVDDLRLFDGWYQAVKTYGCSGFYANVGFVDYPPGLFLIYRILSPLMELVSGRWGMTVALKLPAVLCDLLTGLLFYQLARKQRLAPKWAFIGLVIVLFNPMSVFDSAVWGQVDSVLTLFLLLCLILLTMERYELAAVAFALALLIKPQALAVGPVILFAFLEKVWKRPGYWLLRLLGCLGLFAGTFFLLVMPFSPSGNPLWVCSLYISTMDSYRFISMNAYNFWWSLNLHWTADSLRLGPLTCLQWGYIFVAVGFVVSGVLYFGTSPRQARPLLAGAVFGSLFFMFCCRMHERYLYPAVLFALFLWLYSERLEALAFGSLLSLHNFWNQIGALYWNGKHYTVRRLIAVCGVLLTLGLVIWAFRRCSFPKPQRTRETIPDEKTPPEG